MANEPEHREQGGIIRVAAGLIRDRDGRILLSQRPAGKHLAGTWEFPGGKCEPDESWAGALERELHEELGVRVDRITPCLTLTHTYPEHTIRLALLEVGRVAGRVHGREGQALRWVEPDDLDSLDMPAADRPIVKALTLSPYYAITPDPSRMGGADAVLDWAEQAMANGARLLQLRAHSLAKEELSDLGYRLDALAKRCGARWLLNGSAALALELGADGVHLSGRALRQSKFRPLAEDKLVIASCHDTDELSRAGAIGADLVCVSPVRPTRSHPEAEPLGWSGLEVLCERSPLPVFALGGLAPGDLDKARGHGAFGVAGITGFGAT